MKYKTIKEKYGKLSLQIFAEGETDNQESTDKEDDDTEDDDEDGGEPEKKFSQEDVDNIIKERMRREKRKWQREQQKNSVKEPDGEDKAGGDNDDPETKKLREKAAKADELELKWICMEHGAEKSAVDDLIALAKVTQSKNADMDIEDAIDEVLKKYPSFKENKTDEEDAEEKRKSWGERQKGRRGKKDGVTEAFLAKNPGLKID